MWIKSLLITNQQTHTYVWINEFSTMLEIFIGVMLFHLLLELDIYAVSFYCIIRHFCTHDDGCSLASPSCPR